MSQFESNFALGAHEPLQVHLGEAVQYWRDGEQLADATALGIEEMPDEPADDLDGRGLKRMRRVHMSTQSSDGIPSMDEGGSLVFRGEEWPIEAFDDKASRSVVVVVSRYSSTERSQSDIRFRR